MADDRKSGRELDPVTDLSDTDVTAWWPETVGQEPHKQTYANLRKQIKGDVYIVDANEHDAADHQAVCEAAIAEIEAAYEGNDGGNIAAELHFVGTFHLTDTLSFPSTLTGIRVYGGAFYADASDNWDDETPMIEVDTLRGYYENIRLHPNFLCAGFHNIGGNNIFFGNRCVQHIGYGIKEEGSAGGTWWLHNFIAGFLLNDAEFQDDNLFEAKKGFWVLNNDVKVVGNTFNWNGGGNYYADGDAGSTLVRGNHLFNGRPTGDPSVNAPNIVIHTGSHFFEHNYLDNGTIELYTDNVAFANNFGLNSSRADLDHWARVHGRAGAINPNRLQWRGWKWLSNDLSNGTIPQIEYVPRTLFSGNLSNPFTTATGDNTVIVAHANHGIPAGSGPVTATFSGASVVGGITIDGTYEVTGIDANTYSIEHGSPAGSDATGGGTVATVETATYGGSYGLFADSDNDPAAHDLYIGQHIGFAAASYQQDYVATFLAPNATSTGSYVAFRNADTTDTDGLPSIGCVANRLFYQAQHVDGHTFRNLAHGGGSGCKVRFQDADTVTQPYIRSSTDDLVVSAPVIKPETANTTVLGTGASPFDGLFVNDLVLKPASTVDALTANGQVTIEFTNNTTLTFKARGSDGTTRTATLTLS